MLHFRDGFVWTVSLNLRRNKPAFSNSSGAVWAEPDTLFTAEQGA